MYSTFYIAFFAVAAFSTLCSCLVVLLMLISLESLSQFRNLSASSRLVFYLHAVLIVQDVVSIPWVYADNSILCEAMGFFHVLTGLMNAIIMGLQGVLYREYLLASSLKIIERINKYCEFLIFCLPSIALLPFSTDSYDTNDYPFCTTYVCMDDSPTESHDGFSLLSKSIEAIQN